jgi:predicted DNA-binding transcriptional regulator AlpA
MTKAKPTADEGELLHPDYFYRKHDPITLRVVGYSVSQIGEKVKSGALPPLVQLDDTGRATGWYGRQLIELQRQRLAAAEQAQRKRSSGS